MPQHEDYLLRLIAQAAAALRRLRERLAGGGNASEVLREVETIERSFLGPGAELLRRLDPTSAAALVANDEKLALWVEVLELEANALMASGEPDRAREVWARAAALTETRRRNAAAADRPTNQ